MPDDTILCWRSPFDQRRHITVADYNSWVAEGENGKAKIAEFFRQRLRERYIEPVLRSSVLEENGFSIMALSCLLIETYETFRQGWPSSNRKSKLAFCHFFDRETRFHDFKGFAQEFYQNVRCGILHQGETTGGWTIGLVGQLFAKAGPRINADSFHRTMANVIDDYRDELKNDPLSADVWKKFKTKMNATIKNCKR